LAEPADRFGRGIEGQRRADLGDGSFRNPIVPGDHPDPTVLKDGADYYLTSSSFQSCPGAVIWHSRDLVNWAPVGAALTRPIGSVGAMDLVKHGGRYFLYIPVQRSGRSAIHVVHADDIRGPWSEPVDLGLDGCLGASHAVGEDGQRHLFVDGARRIGLTDDGLATVGGLVTMQVPGFSDARFPAAPKLLRRGEFFYMVWSTDGTARSSAGHAVMAARSRSILGPWGACPLDPLAGAETADEAGWTGGHATLVEGPAADWWLVYHGCEQGHRALGRQVLLEPVEWTRDGWFRRCGSAPDRLQRKPRGGQPSPAGMALSDDFTRCRLGVQWSFFDPVAGELQRARLDGAGLWLRGKGTTLADCSPLTCLVGDRSYEAEIEFEVHGAAQGGLALFHDARGFVGVGIGDGCMHTYNFGKEHSWMQQPVEGRRQRLRVTYRKHLITFHHAAGDGPWARHPWLKDVSGMHQNVSGCALSLRLALFAAGDGEVRLRNFTYQSLER
jgi:xylan 1,4-beta-xylosidase